jgi:hypothetical protein
MRCTWSLLLLLLLKFQSFAEGLGLGVQGLGFSDPRLARGSYDLVYVVHPTPAFVVEGLGRMV